MNLITKRLCVNPKAIRREINGLYRSSAKQNKLTTRNASNSHCNTNKMSLCVWFVKGSLEKNASKLSNVCGGKERTQEKKST